MNSFTCKNVYLNYYKEKKISTLKNINIELPNKGIVGIVGASGAGKSSFLYSLAGLKNKFIAGDVFYKDFNYTEHKEIDMSKLRKEKFGFIFQKHFLIPYLTVEENVLVGLNDNNFLSAAHNYLDMLGIGEYKNEKTSVLSGGELQRVSIVRGILHKPTVIFADEPTAALDRDSSKVVMDLLKSISKDALVLVVSHDHDLYSYFDYKVGFKDGEINLRENI
ncbi:ABC transporter ATP-binding protein [Clostridium estertheticum]|uniref:ABC transporter ATP-binding protein n=1 Tax=Clostridium estertheticum TaxID=238834 RepID=UPI001C7E11BF|nr:ATP-binding cassette domain-containing protein [Clostridium estertheticum]MBX4271786.1 ATP-binding cassette domain-containing protein [Clostridium estertheticum]WLC82269.1 ATP-binding cassette domain-containing protein [Clostridium estertheticum]